jgi:Flp pilus assembly CpaF family ATPase
VDFDDMDEMWHKIREKLAAEDEGLTPAEIVARDNAALEETCRRLGLKIGREADPRKRRDG